VELLFFDVWNFARQREIPYILPHFFDVNRCAYSKNSSEIETV